MLDTATREASGQGLVQLGPLLRLSVQGLIPMFDPEKHLFCYRLQRTAGGMVKEQISHRYTLIALMGLLRAKAAGIHSPIDVESVLAELRRNENWVNNIGDFGLYLWITAQGSPADAARLLDDWDFEAALQKLQDAYERRTMELAWLLTGLSYSQGLPGVSDLGDIAHKVYRLVKENLGAAGFFGHMARAGSWSGRLRGRIGTFADQVYPIYAFAKFGKVFHVPEALTLGLNCARAICGVQGPMGEWCWHYDAVAGRVTSMYPVYSVHQEGMAPMALFAIGDATGENFDGPAYSGLDWITGNNEINYDMREQSLQLVWRSVFQLKMRSRASEALCFVGLNGISGGFQVKYECRPYELGWLLYAFAGRK